MLAIEYTEYGSPEVLTLKEFPKPVPKDNEVLIQIHNSSVTAADCIMRKGEPAWGRLILGLFRPRKRFRILGSEFAGEIEAVGKAVQKFKVGDEVYGFAGFSVGAYAEYKCIAEDASLTIKPSSVNNQQAAAAVDGATSALFFLREKGNIQPGQNVLIIGASGSIGTYAVQLAAYFGAHVTGVCSTPNLELVKSLGAQEVIDYTQEDFADRLDYYDMIFDTVGKSSYAHCKRSLRENGCYIPTVGLANSFWSRWTRIVGGKRVIAGMSIQKTHLLEFLRGLIDDGKLQIIIDRCYPLKDIAEAHHYVDTGRKRGNVVIDVI